MQTREYHWDNFWAQQKKSKRIAPSWSKQRILKILEPYAIPDKKVLDAGCGSGFFSKYFLEKGMWTVALDYSDKALAMTKEITGGRVVILKEDLTDEHLASKISEKFDMVFSDGLLEHFSESEQGRILKNFYNLLTPNGVVITFVPNRFSPWQIIRPFMMRGIRETPLVSSTLASLQIRNGFNIIQSDGINVLPFLFSPDKLLGRYFGMLLYSISNKNV